MAKLRQTQPKRWGGFPRKYRREDLAASLARIVPGAKDKEALFREQPRKPLPERESAEDRRARLDYRAHMQRHRQTKGA
jgi:hypothetical protein